MAAPTESFLKKICCKFRPRVLFSPLSAYIGRSVIFAVAASAELRTRPHAHMCAKANAWNNIRCPLTTSACHLTHCIFFASVPDGHGEGDRRWDAYDPMVLAFEYFSAAAAGNICSICSDQRFSEKAKINSRKETKFSISNWFVGNFIFQRHTPHNLQMERRKIKATERRTLASSSRLKINHIAVGFLSDCSVLFFAFLFFPFLHLGNGIFDVRGERKLSEGGQGKAF